MLWESDSHGLELHPGAVGSWLRTRDRDVLTPGPSSQTGGTAEVQPVSKGLAMMQTATSPNREGPALDRNGQVDISSLGNGKSVSCTGLSLSWEL